MNYLLYERKDDVGLLTINRPKELNSLNSSVVAELSEVLKQIAADSIRCLIITGAGEKAFVAGADIKEMKDLTPKEAAAFSEAGNEVMDLVEALPMPVIAAVNGYALGGGCELSLAADIRIAGERAVFGLPEVSLGIVPGYGGIQRLVRTIGAAKAKELIFTTNRIKAEKALEIGLVNAVVPQEELQKTCMELADKISKNAPFAVRAAKKIANQSIGEPLKNTSLMEVSMFAECFETEDQYHAMEAFAEKRQPELFTGKKKERS